MPYAEGDYQQVSVAQAGVAAVRPVVEKIEKLHKEMVEELAKGRLNDEDRKKISDAMRKPEKIVDRVRAFARPLKKAARIIRRKIESKLVGHIDHDELGRILNGAERIEEIQAILKEIKDTLRDVAELQGHLRAKSKTFNDPKWSWKTWALVIGGLVALGAIIGGVSLAVNGVTVAKAAVISVAVGGVGAIGVGVPAAISLANANETQRALDAAIQQLEEIKKASEILKQQVQEVDQKIEDLDADLQAKTGKDELLESLRNLEESLNCIMKL
mmetsp:Transcript_38122/g.73843  ORF Transcript_38122/g.73843 Transcript_38122/m.73843 type:complete len:272 (+) Transcript_38122:328-1143(+)